MKACFDPVVNEIIKLVMQQLNALKARPQSSVRAVVLVGGFGESRYLQHRIREAIAPIPLLIPGDQ